MLLKDKTFASIRPTMAIINDEVWEKILNANSQMAIPGGAEVDIVAEDHKNGFVTFIMSDPVYPPTKCVMIRELFDATFTEVEKGTSARTSQSIVECGHATSKIDKNCECCFVKWWSQKAKEAGISFDPPKVKGRI